MNFHSLVFEKKDAIGILTINRPQAMNALNAQVISELEEFLSHTAEDKSLRALIVTGAGEKAFVAGADIKEMDDRDPNAGRELAEKGQRVLQMLEDLPIPSIAAVNGFALGGGLELAMACDFIVAKEGAKMGLPEVSLGLIPGYGGTQRLARYCGKGVARLVATTGDIFTAEEFLTWGLVTRVVRSEELMTTCLKWAGVISKRSPKAIRLAKKAINLGFDQSQIEGLKLEAELFGEAFKSSDKVEGVKAFLGKREPHFTGQ